MATVSAIDSEDSVYAAESTSDNAGTVNTLSSSQNINEKSNDNQKELSTDKVISRNGGIQESNLKTSDETEGFSQLQKIIDETESNGTIFLTKDYGADESRKTINITKSITIYGNGHTLDADYLGRIFEITLKSSDVVRLFDLNIVNGYDGADIRVYGGNLYISGCLIRDRIDDIKISRKGSSIYSTRSNLYLTDNILIFTGSGINIYEGRCIVDSCNFIGDNRNNGAIGSFDRTINVNSEKMYVKVSSSVFYNTVSTAKFDIFSEKTEVVANGNWWGTNKNAKPTSIRGKVIVDTWSYLDVNNNVVEMGDTTPITLCLKSNKDDSILSYPLNYSISNVRATNATVFQNGNRIYYTPTNGNSGDISLTFTYYNFSTTMTFSMFHVGRNMVVNSYDELAKTLDNVQKAYYDECTITLEPGNYNATRNIKLTSSNSIKKIIINGNSNVLDGNNKYSFIDVQGVQKSINGLNLTIANATFQNFKTTTGSGSVIRMNMTSGELNIENSKFNNNIASSGGAVDVTKLTGINIYNCSFNNNYASEYGGAVAIYSSQKLNIFNSTFVENEARVGGAAYIVTKQTDIRNSNFVSNKAAYGGAINYNSIVTISDSQFINNFASESAGAIYRNGKLTINNVTFFNNSPQDYDYTGYADDVDDDSDKDWGTQHIVSKKQVRTIGMITVTGSNEKIIIKSNQLTLDVLNRIFNMDFRNGHLIVYIDGKLVFNATTTDDLTQIIYDLLNLLSGNHEIKVEFTDKDGNTNTYTENITI